VYDLLPISGQLALQANGAIAAKSKVGRQGWKCIIWIRMGAVNLKKLRPHIERALHTIAFTATSYALFLFFIYLHSCPLLFCLL
jgi:hypothetical protein